MSKRWLLLLATLLLLIPLLAACGGDDDDDDSGDTTATEQVTQASTETTEATEAETETETEATGTSTSDEASATGTSSDETATGTESGGTATGTESEATSTDEASGSATEAETGTATEADQGSGAAPEDVTVTIGSKNFPEQLILGEMYAQLLEDAGYNVERSLNLGGTAVAHQALVEGEIDLYPEYTGTALLAILGLPTDSDPDAVYQTVKDAYAEQFNLVWLDQAPMNNSQALAMTREKSEELGITTISQMVEQAGDLTLVAPADFEQREDGLVGLKQVYGDFELGDLTLVDPNLKYQTLLSGDADVVLAFGTDGEIKGNDLVILEDDKHLWPPYHVAPVVRQDLLDNAPEIADILNQVQPLLTDDVMQDLNWQVQGPDAMDPADVAHQFLVDNGLLPEE